MKKYSILTFSLLVKLREAFRRRKNHLTLDHPTLYHKSKPRIHKSQFLQKPGYQKPNSFIYPARESSLVPAGFLTAQFVQEI